MELFEKTNNFFRCENNEQNNGLDKKHHLFQTYTKA